MREVYLIFFLSMSSVEGPGQGGGHGLHGTFHCRNECQTGEQAVDHNVQGQRQVRQGALVAALAEDPESFPM